MEASMRKTALTIFGALLISGLAAQVATASELHGSKAYFGRDYDVSKLRRAYNLSNGPIYVTPRTPDGFGFGGRDPSWVGGQDPALNPSGS
jgi:hypothetical protein